MIRLQIIRDGQGLHWLQRLILSPLKLMEGSYPPPILVLSYRREMFGKYFARFLQRSMRKTKEWSKAEVELFASFTAAQLQCEY